MAPFDQYVQLGFLVVIVLPISVLGVFLPITVFGSVLVQQLRKVFGSSTLPSPAMCQGPAHPRKRSRCDMVDMAVLDDHLKRARTCVWTPLEPVPAVAQAPVQAPLPASPAPPPATDATCTPALSGTINAQDADLRQTTHAANPGSTCQPGPCPLDTERIVATSLDVKEDGSVTLGISVVGPVHAEGAAASAAASASAADVDASSEGMTAPIDQAAATLPPCASKAHKLRMPRLFAACFTGLALPPLYDDCVVVVLDVGSQGAKGAAKGGARGGVAGGKGSKVAAAMRRPFKAVMVRVLRR